MQDKIQKINFLYLLGYILGPIAICALSFTIGYFCFADGGAGAVICFLLFPILAAIWWIFAGSFLFKQKTKELEQRFTDEGYQRNHTFYGKGKTVILDVEKGMLGIIFFWNPFQSYIIPASRIGQAWTDDGRMGSGFMEGSSQVRFLFTIDDIKVSVPTFSSNQRFRMDDKHILTGISKADLMVQSLKEAKKNAKASKNSDKSADKSDKSTKTEKTAK